MSTCGYESVRTIRLSGERGRNPGAQGVLGSPHENGFSLLDNRSKTNRKHARDAERRAWGSDSHVRMKIVRSQTWLKVLRDLLYRSANPHRQAHKLLRGKDPAELGLKISIGHFHRRLSELPGQL